MKHELLGSCVIFKVKYNVIKEKLTRGGGMKLRKIFIQGFKSFADPVELTISDGITAIVGPNGSGKSNIMDAIKWLFGQQSLKNLRADEKYDLIFAGSENLPPSRKAFVELTFETEDGAFLTVARELTREGKNTFLINRKPSRLKDIKDLFAGTGVGKDFYSVIAQGQVERIVSSSSKELRNLFEEAAGTAAFREKKKETMQKLERVEANLRAIDQVIYERGKLMQSLYLKAKRAERYLEYSAKLKEVKKLYYGNLIIRQKEKIEGMERELEEKRESLRNLRKEMAQVESRWSSLRTEMEEMDKKLSSFTKMLEDFDKRKKQLLDLKNLYHQRLSKVEGEYIRVATEISSKKEELERLKKRKEEISAILKGITSEKKDLESKVEGLERKKEEISSRLSEREKKALEIREKIGAAEKEIMKLNSELARLDDNVKDMASRLEFIEEQLLEKRERLKDIEREIESLTSTLEAATKREKELLQELNVLIQRREEIRSKRENILSEMNELLRKKSEIEGHINSLRHLIEEYAGFSQAVRAIFKNKERFEGLYDVVANIIEIEEGTEQAIGALLGGAMQNVVVKSAEVAKQIIEFLKEGDYGRATFLPLDMLQASVPQAGQVKNHPGFVGLAADLVRVPEGFEVLPSYLFGNDIVVRTLDDAIEIKRKYKVKGRIATLEGDIISSRGAITGGSVKKYEDPILGRKTKLKALEEEKAAISDHLKELESELKVVEEQIREIQKQEDEVRELLSEATTKASSTKRVLQELLKTSEELRNDVDSLEKLKVNYTAKIAGAEARMDNIRHELGEKRAFVKRLEGELERFSKESDEIREELEKVSMKLIDLGTKLAETKQKEESYKREMEENLRREEQIRKELAELKGKEAELQKSIKEVEEQLKENEEQLKAISTELEELFSSMNLHHEDKTKLLEEVQKLEKTLSDLKEKREEIVENIHSLELDLQDAKNALSRYEEELPEGAEDVTVVNDEELRRLEEEKDSLLSKLKRIGSVDLDSVEEYKRVEKDYNELLEQREDLLQAKKKLKDIMKKTEEEAKNRFLEVFNKVNENFSKYISQLFFGGEGRIRMISEENVLESELEIVVKKPGRKIQKLQLLSGGEKALVAIALLFSFLSVNPSPFYVLDEVDGPLDDYNAERFAKFLRHFSKDAQFIVITHNKIVMEAADVLHGITMTDGVSLVIPVQMLQTG